MSGAYSRTNKFLGEYSGNPNIPMSPPKPMIDRLIELVVVISCLKSKVDFKSPSQLFSGQCA